MESLGKNQCMVVIVKKAHSYILINLIQSLDSLKVIDEVEKYQMIHTVRFAKILSQKSALIATKIATFDVTVNTKTKQPSHAFFTQIRQVY